MRLAATLLFFIFGAVVGLGQAGAQQVSDGRRTIGVISTIGETFTLQKIGLMVTGNDTKQFGIEAWAIDDLVVGKVASLVSKRFAVQKIGGTSGAFADLEQAGFNPFRDLNAEFQSRVRKIGARQTCDFYVVITKAATPFGTTHQALSGLGLVENSGLFGSFYLHALSAITVFDGRTFERLGEKRASIGQANFLATIKGPHREVDASAWPTGQLSQNQGLRSATWKLLEQSLAVTLPELIQTN